MSVVLGWSSIPIGHGNERTLNWPALDPLELSVKLTCVSVVYLLRHTTLAKRLTIIKYPWLAAALCIVIINTSLQAF